MKRPNYNIHSHTARCGHARGEDEEYVLAAREAGFTTLGFSDHVMLPFASQPGIRGDYSELESYISSVGNMKKKYAGQMRIFTGFEAEWYGKEKAAYYRELLSRPDFDYMIMGQHCFYENGDLMWYGAVALDSPYDALVFYHDDVIEGIESGLFRYVAHPDTYLRWYGAYDQLARKVALDIASCAKRFGVALEINAGMLNENPAEVKRKGTLAYPCPRFWDDVATIMPPVVIGVDAHDPRVYRTTDYEYLCAFAEERGISLLPEAPIPLKG